MPQLASYRVWDAPTRWFHWINLLCVVGLVAAVSVILNASALGVANAGAFLYGHPDGCLGHNPLGRPAVAALEAQPALHAVVVTEMREGGSLVSAMFTGRKILAGRPADADDRDTV
jgi:cytochrome b